MFNWMNQWMLGSLFSDEPIYGFATNLYTIHGVFSLEYHVYNHVHCTIHLLFTNHTSITIPVKHPFVPHIQP